jgi:hypothetical protein
VEVDWTTAQDYCRRLQEKERGRFISENHRYRLPTDLEWSLAFGLPEEPGATPLERSGRVGEPWYVWGREFPPRVSCGNFAPFVSFDYFEGLAPAGMFPPNERGLYDLGGNVWEWCEDLLEPKGTERVLRGGSWKWGVVHEVYSSAWLASFRRGAPPNTKEDDIGFRVVLEITDATPAPAPRPAAQPETPSKNVPPAVLAMRQALGWRGKSLGELSGERNFTPKPNLTEARRQWETAARAGDADAQFRVWYLIDHGLLAGRRSEETLATNYLARAAQSGFDAARLEYALQLFGELKSQSNDSVRDALVNTIRNHCQEVLRHGNRALAARATYLLYELEHAMSLRRGMARPRGDSFMLEADVLQWLFVADHLGHWRTASKLRENEDRAQKDAAARMKWETAKSNAWELLKTARREGE